jgi:hypothetical protein
MPRSADDKERSCWRARYSRCDGFAESRDVIFVFPVGEYCRSEYAQAVCNQIQKAWTFLIDVTGRNPVDVFKQRTIVGFRHPVEDDDPNCQPGFDLQDGEGFPEEKWPFINLPWSCVDSHDQPEEAISHEFVHPFLRAYPLHHGGDDWVEGVCEFLRVPVLHAMNLNTLATAKQDLFLSNAWKTGANTYHDCGGRLLKWFANQGFEVRNKDHVKEACQSIWTMNFSEELEIPI